jgi:hypothetical protein
MSGSWPNAEHTIRFVGNEQKFTENVWSSADRPAVPAAGPAGHPHLPPRRRLDGRVRRPGPVPAGRGDVTARHRFNAVRGRLRPPARRNPDALRRRYAAGRRPINVIPRRGLQVPRPVAAAEPAEPAEPAERARAVVSVTQSRRAICDSASPGGGRQPTPATGRSPGTWGTTAAGGCMRRETFSGREQGRPVRSRWARTRLQPPIFLLTTSPLVFNIAFGA